MVQCLPVYRHFFSVFAHNIRHSSEVFSGSSSNVLSLTIWKFIAIMTLTGNKKCVFFLFCCFFFRLMLIIIVYSHFSCYVHFFSLSKGNGIFVISGCLYQLHCSLIIYLIFSHLLLMGTAAAAAAEVLLMHAIRLKQKTGVLWPVSSFHR